MLRNLRTVLIISSICLIGLQASAAPRKKKVPEVPVAETAQCPAIYDAVQAGLGAEMIDTIKVAPGVAAAAREHAKLVVADMLDGVIEKSKQTAVLGKMLVGDATKAADAAAEWLYNNGLMKQYKPATFKPEEAGASLAQGVVTGEAVKLELGKLVEALSGISEVGNRRFRAMAWASKKPLLGRLVKDPADRMMTFGEQIMEIIKFLKKGVETLEKDNIDLSKIATTTVEKQEGIEAQIVADHFVIKELQGAIEKLDPKDDRLPFLQAHVLTMLMRRKANNTNLHATLSGMYEGIDSSMRSNLEEMEFLNDLTRYAVPVQVVAASLELSKLTRENFMKSGQQLRTLTNQAFKRIGHNVVEDNERMAIQGKQTVMDPEVVAETLKLLTEQSGKEVERALEFQRTTQANQARLSQIMADGKKLVEDNLLRNKISNTMLGGPTPASVKKIEN